MIVSPFTILIDTREVQPWKFQNVPGKKGEGTIVVPRKWQSLGNGYGDYTIKGAESQDCRWRMAIERKSLRDLYNTVLTRRRQFVTELENLNRMEYSAVVVEANLSTVLHYIMPHWKEQKLPLESQFSRRSSVVGSIQAWQLRYPTIRWWFLPRKFADIWAYRLLNRFWEDKMK